MSTGQTTFGLLIRQARSGDASAAAQMVEQYEPALRREIRMIHTDPNLKRVYDTTDLVQSVLGNFFIRLAAGQFDFEHPQQLVKLLSKMAKNKLINYARSRKPPDQLASQSAIVADVECPSEIVSRKDLLDKIRGMLSDQERQIADRRTGGIAWEDIAAEMDGDAEALRKQYARALNRVARQLDLDEMDD